MAAKAAALAADRARFKASGERGVRKYVKQEQADPAIGQVGSVVAVLSLDIARLAADAALDGHWVLQSSRIGALDWGWLAPWTGGGWRPGLGVVGALDWGWLEPWTGSCWRTVGSCG